MENETSKQPSADVTRAMPWRAMQWRIILWWSIRETLSVVMLALFLFLSAGRWNWFMGWVLVAITALWVIATGLVVIPRYPELLAERLGPRKGAKTWDTTIMVIEGQYIASPRLERSQAMPLTMRAYQTEDDYWRIRAFLHKVFLLNDRRELCWQIARLDYWRWHVIENCNICDPVKDVTFIWETPDRQIAAVLNPEGRGAAHLQVHPGLRTTELEEEMIVVAEQRLAGPGSNGQRVLRVFTDGRDTLRHDILLHRGYTRRGLSEHQWRRELDVPVPDVPVAPGYTVRSLGDVDELPARSWASWRAFHPAEPDEHYEGWEWYHNIQRMPLYRRDLDLVAVAPTGEIASFCTVWYDDVTRSACYEPVGTMLEHQRRGLAKAVLTEGLRRLERMGATRAFVGGYEPGPNALYTSVMGAEHDLSEPWVKEW